MPHRLTERENEIFSLASLATLRQQLYVSSGRFPIRTGVLRAPESEGGSILVGGSNLGRQVK